MADKSGRRTSSRATKGQHTKSQDILDTPPESKKKATKRSSKKAPVPEEEEEEVEIIRCVCGALETGDDEGEPWIACDKCGVWQHNVCVGIPTFDEDIPDTYLCEQCAPANHKDLLDAIKGGEKLWETRRKVYEQEQAEQKAKEDAVKKRGKKKGGKRQSGLKLDSSQSTNGQAKSPSTPSEPKKETPARSSSLKRKATGTPSENDSAKIPPKVRKVSEAHVTPSQSSPVSDVPTKMGDLPDARKGSAKLIIKSLMATIPNAIKAGVYTLKPGDTVDRKAESLAVQIEHALFSTHPNHDAYSKQARTLIANVKTNQELCNGLLTQKLSPQALAVMTTDDMASKELKLEKAAMKAKSEKQSILTTETGPLIRRTHKGDELVERDNNAISDDIPGSTKSRRRSMFSPNEDMVARSRENTPARVELPEQFENNLSTNDVRSAAVPKEPLNMQTKQHSQPTERKPSTQSDFDIKKVLDHVSVQSPVGPAPPPMRQASGNAPPPDGPGVDPEIDKMLQDDDGNESPPYSPAEYDSDPEIVWRGIITMETLAFHATAKHVAGADLSSRIPYSELFPKDLKVAGRIELDKANEYLCSLRFGPPTDLVVIAISPTGESATSTYRELFEYFHARNRYGVLSNKGVGNIRDTYLVPVPASPDNLPDFILNLDGQKIPNNRPEPMLLVALVFRLQDAAHNSEGGEQVQSPSMANNPQDQMPVGGAGPSMSPIAPQGGFQSAPPSTPQPTPEEIRRQQEEQERYNLQKEGEASAHRILGQYVNAPTVSFLLPQAYQMRDEEWQVVRDILANDPKAQQDLQYLSNQISQKQPPGDAS